MKKFIIKRLVQLIPIIIGITLLSFLLVNVSNTDAIDMLEANRGTAISEEQKNELREELGLDQPVIVRYVVWLKGVITGNMGNSYISGKPVFATFISKLPATIYLCVVSILLTLIISLPLGIIAAVNKNRCIDYIIRLLSFLGNSMPNFFAAIMLIYIFALKLNLLPVMGMNAGIKSVILPAVTLAIAMSSRYIRQIRTAVINELQKDYVQGAIARGVGRLKIITGSVLKSSLLTIITLLALSIGSLLGGTAIVESIFMWDGVGKMAIDAITMRDYPVIQAYVIWMAIIYVVINLKKRTENVNNNRQRLIFRGKINKSNTSLIIWLIFALLIVLIAVLADVIVPYDPYEQDLSAALMPPDSHHLLGTDQYGRDMLSRVIKGAGISLSSSFALVVIITLTGCIAGIISGYYGGIIDSIIMRLSDIFLAFPGLVFAIAVASVMSGGLVSAVIALALISWPKYARIARAEVLAIKNEPYIQVARMSGLNTIRILIKHIIPNIADIIIVTAVLDIGNMMMEIAGLSFLGLGAEPPLAEWGLMVSQGRSFMQTAPWVVIAPGLAIFITVLVFNMLGDTLSDITGRQ